LFIVGYFTLNRAEAKLKTSPTWEGKDSADQTEGGHTSDYKILNQQSRGRKIDKLRKAVAKFSKKVSDLKRRRGKKN